MDSESWQSTSAQVVRALGKNRMPAQQIHSPLARQDAEAIDNHRAERPNRRIRRAQWQLSGGKLETVETSYGRLAQSANSPSYIMSFSGNLTDR
jgi:hypothetical protein